MILLKSMSDKYHVIKNTFQYSGSVLFYELVCHSMRTRELELKGNKSKAAAGLVAKGKGKVQTQKGMALEMMVRLRGTG